MTDRPMNTQPLTVEMLAALQGEGGAVGLQSSFLCFVVEEADGGGAAERHHVVGEVVVCGVEVEAQSGHFQPLLVHVGQVADQVLFWCLGGERKTKEL